MYLLHVGVEAGVVEGLGAEHEREAEDGEGWVLGGGEQQQRDRRARRRDGHHQRPHPARPTSVSTCQLNPSRSFSNHKRVQHNTTQQIRSSGIGPPEPGGQTSRTARSRR
eukprot:7804420-Pyramimonas_sp.AAC.1